MMNVKHEIADPLWNELFEPLVDDRNSNIKAKAFAKARDGIKDEFLHDRHYRRVDIRMQVNNERKQ